MSFWIILLIIFIITEVITTQLISIWFALGSLGAIIASLLGASDFIQWTIFFVITIISIFTTRPVLKKIFFKEYIPTNGELDIGEKAEVIETIDNSKSTGRAKLRGVDWIARSHSGEIIPAGQMVIIIEKQSNTLIVERQNEE